MKKFVKATILIGAFLEFASLIMVILIVVNWKSLSWLVVDESKLEFEDIQITIPYANIFLYAFEFVIFLLLFFVIVRQFNSGKGNIVPEIFTLIYSIGIHPLAVLICTNIFQILYARILPNPNFEPDLYRTSVIAYQTIISCVNFINQIIMYVGVAFVLVGCSASIVTKKNILRQQ